MTEPAAQSALWDSELLSNNVISQMESFGKSGNGNGGQTLSDELSQVVRLLHSPT